MAVSYVWPLSLPQAPLKYPSETGGVLMLSTPMDRGPAKRRRLGAKPSVLTVGYLMSRAQVAAFVAFVEDTLKGTARFGYPHPRTRQQVEARLVPSDGGDLYSAVEYVPGKFRVDFTVEVLP